MYTTKQIIDLYNLPPTPRTDKQAFIPYCKRRGIEIEFEKKEGRTNYYNIISDNRNIYEDEIWEKCIDLPEYQISNYGRIKKGDIYCNLSTNDYGYQVLNTTDGKKYRVHRLVLNTFNYNENSNSYIVDHINGKKTDNRLENLRWLTNMENIQESAINRKPLEKELTRLIEKYGYEKTLEIISNIS